MLSLLLTLWMTVLPKGVILVKGATASASDTSTPLPENGSVANGRYRNAYFGLSYPIPAGWSEQPAGPPPSDGGSYVLAQFALFGDDGQRVKAHVLVTAQDLFFALFPGSDARELVATRGSVVPQYQLESGPEEVTIGGRTFHRLAYSARRSGLHWRILATDSRCHAVTFTFTGTDVAALDAAERALGGVSFAADEAAPQCAKDYARGDNVVASTDPQFTNHRFNTIPVRIVIAADGTVKHVHLLSAFPEQSEAILTALRTWRFKPYVVDGKPVEVETGLLFGVPRTAPIASTSK